MGGFCIHDNGAEGSADDVRITPLFGDLFFRLSVGVGNVLQAEYHND